LTFTASTTVITGGKKYSDWDITDGHSDEGHADEGHSDEEESLLDL
jgi:hypothetical protein